MNSKRNAVVLAAGLLGLGIVLASARADEVDLPLDQLPKAVADAAKAKFPGAKWSGAAKETEDGKTLYEVSMSHEGRKLDVTFKADGTLEVVEAEIAVGDLPKPVASAVKDKYPGAKINLIESVTKGPEVKKDADSYEIHLTTAAKKSVEIVLDASGKILDTEEGGEEKEKG
jgi:hypothetical protein